MTGLLEGRVALVTGAGQGVGRGIALALAAEGASVVVAGRTLSKCEAVAAEVEALGAGALAVRCDVKDPEDVAACVDAAVARFGTVDVLVNNAQEVPRGRLLDVEEGAFEAGWASGPLATFRFMRACHPHLCGGGVVINLGSRSGIKPDQTGVGAYAAVKEAIRALTRAAAVEWAGDGIRVYALLPLADSPALQRVRQEEPAKYDEVLSEIPMRRFGDPVRDIGRVAVFLAGDDAAYLTGVTLTVDGGAGFVG